VDRHRGIGIETRVCEVLQESLRIDLGEDPRLPRQLDERRSTLDDEPVLTRTQLDPRVHAVPFLDPGELQRGSLLDRTPCRTVTEPLAERLDPCRGFAEVESRVGEPMRHSRHAMGDDVRKRGMASESERKAEPPVANPEQDRGGEPIRLLEPIAPVFAEVRAVAAQE